MSSLIIQKVKQGQVSPALIAGEGGGIGTPAPLADLRKQYDERVKEIPQGDRNALIALKKEFRDKGLPIY